MLKDAAADCGKAKAILKALGTVLAYTGDKWAMELVGHGAGATDLAVQDVNGANAAGGVRVLADGVLVESTIVRNVLAYGFIAGVGFGLMAVNDGGIAYGSYYDVRVRHALEGIRIAVDESAMAFVNSNTFFSGVFSGGGFDYGLRVLEGNNNVFYGMSFEASHTKYGHIAVETKEAQVELHNIRIEAKESFYPFLLLM